MSKPGGGMGGGGMGGGGIMNMSIPGGGGGGGGGIVGGLQHRPVHDEQPGPEKQSPFGHELQQPFASQLFCGQPASVQLNWGFGQEGGPASAEGQQPLPSQIPVPQG